LAEQRNLETEVHPKPFEGTNDSYQSSYENLPNVTQYRPNSILAE